MKLFYLPPSLFAILFIWACQPQEKSQVPEDWFFRQRAFPSGEIDPNIYYAAIEHQREQLQQRNGVEGYNDPWIQEGPTNIGGRVTDIEMPSDDQERIYVGSASGGIFRSDDLGRQWEKIFDEATSLSIGDLALAPSNEQVIYVGTGESNAGGGSIAYDGDGVYRSDDGGDSWMQRGLEDVGSIGKVQVHPLNEDIVYVAAMGHLFRNNDERGVYKSIDGGVTWDQVLMVNNTTGAIDIIIHPTHHDTIYAAMWQRVRRPEYRDYGGPSSGIYRSYDGGETWQELSGNLPTAADDKGRIGIAIASSDPSIVYANYATRSGDFKGVYRSDDGGDTWKKKSSSGVFSVSFMWWFGRISVDPQDANTVYLTSIDDYKSTDGGDSWQETFRGAHPDHHRNFVHPANTDLVLNGNDGGVLLSTDGGASSRSLSGYPSIQFYSCHINPHDPKRFFGGTQDNGTLSRFGDKDDEWRMIFGADGFRVLVDPIDPDRLYVSFQYGNLFRSEDRGETFDRIANSQEPAGTHNWYTPYVIDPQDNSILYYGTDRVYRSDDRGDSWSAISGELPNRPGTGNLSYGTITSISVSRLNTQVIYAGTDDGNVHVTRDGGGSWTNISQDLPLRWITAVEADPTNESVVHMTTSGFRYGEDASHIFRSSDYGETWEELGEDIGNVPINDIIRDPRNDLDLYVATDIGVYYSLDGGEEWSLLGSDMPTVVVTDIDLHPSSGTLLAATYGRSMFSYQLPVSTASTDVEEESVRIFPNPASEYIKISNAENSGRLEVEIYNMAGQRILVKSVVNGFVDISSLKEQSYLLRVPKMNYSTVFVKL